MPFEQSKIAIAPAVIMHPNSKNIPKGPMTSKQVKKAYKERNAGPKMTKAEQRKEEQQIREAQRLELEKEKRLEREKRKREKKREEEEQAKRERRKRGEPEKSRWVRPSQNRITGFIGLGKRNREDDTMADADTTRENSIVGDMRPLKNKRLSLDIPDDDSGYASPDRDMDTAMLNITLAVNEDNISTVDSQEDNAERTASKAQSQCKNHPQISDDEHTLAKAASQGKARSQISDDELEPVIEQLRSSQLAEAPNFGTIGDADESSFMSTGKFKTPVVKKAAQPSPVRMLADPFTASQDYDAQCGDMEESCMDDNTLMADADDVFTPSKAKDLPKLPSQKGQKTPSAQPAQQVQEEIHKTYSLLKSRPTTTNDPKPRGQATFEADEDYDSYFLTQPSAPSVQKLQPPAQKKTPKKTPRKASQPKPQPRIDVDEDYDSYFFTQPSTLLVQKSNAPAQNKTPKKTPKKASQQPKPRPQISDNEIDYDAFFATQKADGPLSPLFSRKEVKETPPRVKAQAQAQAMNKVVETPKPDPFAASQDYFAMCGDDPFKATQAAGPPKVPEAVKKVMAARPNTSRVIQPPAKPTMSKSSMQPPSKSAAFKTPKTNDPPLSINYDCFFSPDAPHAKPFQKTAVTQAAKSPLANMLPPARPPPKQFEASQDYFAMCGDDEDYDGDITPVLPAPKINMNPENMAKHKAYIMRQSAKVAAGGGSMKPPPRVQPSRMGPPPLKSWNLNNKPFGPTSAMPKDVPPPKKVRTISEYELRRWANQEIMGLPGSDSDSESNIGGEVFRKEWKFPPKGNMTNEEHGHRHLQFLLEAAMTCKIKLGIIKIVDDDGKPFANQLGTLHKIMDEAKAKLFVHHPPVFYDRSMIPRKRYNQHVPAKQTPRTMQKQSAKFVHRTPQSMCRTYKQRHSAPPQQVAVLDVTDDFEVVSGTQLMRELSEDPELNEKTPRAQAIISIPPKESTGTEHNLSHHLKWLVNEAPRLNQAREPLKPREQNVVRAPSFEAALAQKKRASYPPAKLANNGASRFLPQQTVNAASNAGVKKPQAAPKCRKPAPKRAPKTAEKAISSIEADGLMDLDDVDFPSGTQLLREMAEEEEQERRSRSATVVAPPRPPQPPKVYIREPTPIYMSFESDSQLMREMEEEESQEKSRKASETPHTQQNFDIRETTPLRKSGESNSQILRELAEEEEGHKTKKASETPCPPQQKPLITTTTRKDPVKPLSFHIASDELQTLSQIEREMAEEEAQAKKTDQNPTNTPAMKASFRRQNQNVTPAHERYVSNPHSTTRNGQNRTTTPHQKPIIKPSNAPAVIESPQPKFAPMPKGKPHIYPITKQRWPKMGSLAGDFCEPDPAQLAGDLSHDDAEKARLQAKYRKKATSGWQGGWYQGPVDHNYDSEELLEMTRLEGVMKREAEKNPFDAWRAKVEYDILYMDGCIHPPDEADMKKMTEGERRRVGELVRVGMQDRAYRSQVLDRMREDEEIGKKAGKVLPTNAERMKAPTKEELMGDDSWIALSAARPARRPTEAVSKGDWLTKTAENRNAVGSARKATKHPPPKPVAVAPTIENFEPEDDDAIMRKLAEEEMASRSATPGHVPALQAPSSSEVARDLLSRRRQTSSKQKAPFPTSRSTKGRRQFSGLVTTAAKPSVTNMPPPSTPHVVQSTTNISPPVSTQPDSRAPSSTPLTVKRARKPLFFTENPEDRDESVVFDSKLQADRDEAKRKAIEEEQARQDAWLQELCSTQGAREIQEKEEKEREIWQDQQRKERDKEDADWKKRFGKTNVEFDYDFEQDKRDSEQMRDDEERCTSRKSRGRL